MTIGYGFSQNFQVLQYQKRKVHAYTLNPKAISRVHLLGLIDPATREWTDGVLTKVARLIVSEAGKHILCVNFTKMGFINIF